ncbi:TonB-dependent receptor [Chitinophaga sp. XS-30]|uniref:TonB-dependent receptor n=1 Tax=Chitinophaga sp. XS-30 TaxID=2604421 RepID=UPI0011DD14A7|nr:TonB-dependent receptor [Chitinophaga sp. XS-30]QEH42965.1 TonB-dependent receptor [Chitinophaga sp. XS-30]
MRLTTILLLTFLMESSAEGFSQQRITLSRKDAAIRQVFQDIRKQTGYDFLYSNKVLASARPVSVSVQDATLDEVLRLVMKDQPLAYNIVEKTVIVKLYERPATRDTVPSIPVSGLVSDDKGQALPGVTVQVKGTSAGTVTDNDGKFSITVSGSDAVLEFSYLGFARQERPVGTTTVFNITLQPSNEGLNEVVVVGYGTVMKKDLTGSLTQVKSREINAVPAANVLQALSGRAAGVHVLQNNGSPGGPVSVRIRGTNSIMGSNEPLYVVDGFPVSGTNPTVLNNMDIETIDILKDASATAIYGSRGANGVVLITTKRGKAGKTKVDFETSYSTQSLRKKLDLMNAKEYAIFYNERAVNDNQQPYFTQEQIDNFGEGYDWQDLVFQTAPMQLTSLNVSGGNEKTQFSLSGSVFAQNGIVKGSDYNRYSLRTNINHEISKKFSVNFSGTFSRLQTDRKDSRGGSRGNSMIAAAISAPPTLTPYNDDGSYRVLATAYPFIATDLINPINFINEQTTSTKANVVLANAALIYHPLPDFTVKISGGIENRDDRTDTYTTTRFVNSQGVASVGASQFTSLLSENTISYNKTAGKHNIAAVAGFTYQDFLTTFVNGRGVGFLSDASQTYDLGAADAPGIPGSGYAKSALVSLLARVNYSYDNKYLATISFRQDGSSRYSEGNKWGGFPSAAIAWRVSEEDFLKDIGFFSDLKLRASWGYTGSQAISPYATLNQLGSGKTVFDDALATTYAPGTVLPGDLKWETTEQKDIGLDIGILDNRVVVTADYYVKTTKDLLNNVILPSSMGFQRTVRNVGEVRNQGFEFGVDARILTGAFKWDLNTNISMNRNKVLKLYDGEDILGGSVNAVVVSDISNILREGQPIGRFWGYLEDGYDDNGRIRFVDVDKDGSITAQDKTYIGDPNPDFIYGINSNMSYRNFSLSIFIQGSQGNDIFNISSIGNTIDYGFGLNMPREVYENHWTPSSPNAKYPVISYNTTVRASDRFVEDGSYMRLRNVELGYDLPVQKAGINWLRNLRIYASGQNLLTFTKYSWWDPEVNSNGGENSTAQGYDNYSYPTARSFTFGIRAGF